MIKKQSGWWKVELSTWQVNVKQTSFLSNEFFENKVIEWNLHVDKTSSPHHYDKIIGHDLSSELGIILHFNGETVTWEESTIKMKDYDALMDISLPEHEFYWHEKDYESQALKDACFLTSEENFRCEVRTSRCPSNSSWLQLLTADKQKQLLTLLHKCQHLFDGTLGTWNGEPYNIELKPEAKPYHSRPFPVPKIHEAMLKVELDHLCKVDILKQVNQSEWVAPTFLIPKKDATIWFISDFCKLHKRIKRKPYPILKIQDLLLKLEDFQYATILNLNMGYYLIKLTPFRKHLCTIVTPFGKN